MTDTPARADVFVHESAYVDEPSTIGAGTKIWHFCHVLPRVVIGENCGLGQNVVVGPDVVIGDRCKIQNNVSVYKGVTLEDGVVGGGVGQRLRSRLGEAGAVPTVLNVGIPQRFLAHGSRDEVLEEIGLTPAKIAMRVLDAALSAEVSAERLGHERGEELDLPRPGA